MARVAEVAVTVALAEAWGGRVVADRIGRHRGWTGKFRLWRQWLRLVMLLERIRFGGKAWGRGFRAADGLLDVGRCD